MLFVQMARYGINSEWLQLETYESTNSVTHIFALRTTNGIVGSNPIRKMDICVFLVCVNPLTPNDLKRRRTVSPLKIKIPSKNMREKPTDQPIIHSVC
jgi:hypothetical protein